MASPRYTFFLAHAGTDTPRARELRDLLLARGVSTFLDAVDLTPGDLWPSAVCEAQQAARATVALVSGAADDAYYLGEEIAAAIAYQHATPLQSHRLIPVYLDGRPAETDIPFGLRVRHALDARAAGGFAVVADELARVAAVLQDEPAPTAPLAPPTSRAPERLRLYQALCGLTEADFESVLALVALGGASAGVAAPGAARPFRARDIVQWAEARDPATYKLILDHALKHTPWLAWLEARRGEAGLVRVPGRDRDVAFDAADLVVPLQLQLHGRGPRDLPPSRAHAHQADTGGVVTGSFHDALRVVEQRKLCLGLALIGDPGCGKTTLLQQIFCAVYDHGSRALGLPPDLTPVFVRCKMFERLGPPENWTFPALVAEQAAVDGHAGAAAALFKTRRPLLLLLDGLDEVRDEPTRQALCAWLSEAALARRDDWRFVVTSRIATWQRRSRLPEDHFLVTDVLALDRPTVHKYIRLWFQAVAHSERRFESDAALAARAQAESDELIAALDIPDRADHRHLAELMGNPLSLALLCQVHTRHGELPERLSELYEACLHVFLERRPGTQQRPFLPRGPARAVLQPLAWHMQSEALDDLPRKAMENEVALTLHRLKDLRRMKAAAFVEVAWKECGLLRERDFGSLGFFHAALREYLAAAYAVEEGRLADLAAHAGEDRWRNVLLLAMGVKGGFSGLAQALWRAGRLAAHEELLRGGLRGAMSVEPEPFVVALRAALPAPRDEAADGPSPRFPTAAAATTAEDVLAILRIFQDHDEPEILEAARALEAHENERVRHGVRQALALGEAAQRDGAAHESQPHLASKAAPLPAPGALWREPVTGITFVWVPPGEYWMGSSKTPGHANYDKAAYNDETPPRRVRFTCGFWMAQHPVTNEVYGRFLAAARHRKPEFWRNARFNEPEQPVVGVDVHDALAFCAWATKAASVEPKRRIDLPTEPEWEYAARAADGDRPARRYPWGHAEPTPERAVFGGAGLAACVGRPAGATPLGIHDLAGNVWEWCLDAWGGYPKNLPQVDVDPWPLPPPRAVPRVVRGGSWGLNPGSLRAAHRYGYHPDYRDKRLGFRVVCRGSRQHVGP